MHMHMQVLVLVLVLVSCRGRPGRSRAQHHLAW